MAMKRLRVNEDVRSVTELKQHAYDVLEHVRQHRRPLLLTRRGKGVAVVLDVVEYQELIDRVEFIEAVKEGLEEAASDKLHPNSAALKILDSFGK